VFGHALKGFLMNVIDQRILIPANPDVIWNVISNINDNPKWQVNCQHVSFLTTEHKGQGMRYRSTNPNGRDIVIEITAWYENVGYAYKIIDGISARSNSGRFRLQEITEGTIVQWVFEYEPSGLLGGIKNSLSTKRTFEREIIQSLENLWRVINDIQAGKPYVSRTAMREAPDVESRAQYKTRHDKPATTASTHNALSSFLKLDEPPIKEGDTRPHPADPTPPSGIAPVVSDDIFIDKSVSASSEPDFLRSLDVPVADSASDHSIFQPPTPEKADAQPIVEPSDKPEAITSEPVSESLFNFKRIVTPAEPVFTESIFDAPIVQPEKTAEQPAEAPVQPTEEAPSTPEPVSTLFEPETPVSAEEGVQTAVKDHDEATTSPAPSFEPVVKDDDTSQKSIFEIFGLPKPSETQQMPPVVIEQHLPLVTEAKPAIKSEPVETASSIDPNISEVGVSQAPTTPPAEKSAETIGLRANLRRKNSKVRTRS
jgi:hypothetical protein